MKIPQQFKNPEFRFVKLGRWNEWARYEKDKQTGKTKIAEKKIINPEKLDTTDFKVWKPLGKAPFEFAWEKNGYKFDDRSLINHPLNFGIIGGYGNLAILDIDDLDLAKSMQLDTLTIQTGSGGKHFYFIIEDFENIKKNEVLSVGELRVKNYQVVCCPSRHPTGNDYKIILDTEIKKVSAEYIYELIKPYMKDNSIKKTTATTPQKTEGKGVDTSRSAFEYGEVIKAINKGMNKEQVFKHMENFSKWASSPEGYKNLTYEKCLGVASLEKKKEKVNPVVKDDLDIKSIADYRHLKVNKNFIVENFLYPNSTNMIYSPPAEFKSMVALDMAFAIATGKEFLDFKTKKQPVLYCDGENSDLIVKDRIEKIHKGRKLKRWKTMPLYFLSHGIMIDERKREHFGFISALEDFIEKKKIKVIIFDTLHRFAFYDENKADDINLLYTKVFRPLIEKYKVSIVFLHHSTKQGNYRGTGDFLGIVDVCYKIWRQGKTDNFRIVNEKSRSGEISDIAGHIVFGEQYIKINSIDLDAEVENKINKQKELSNKVLSLFEIGIELRKIDVKNKLEDDDYDYDERCLTRALKYLVDTNSLDKTGRGVYRKIR